MTSFTEPAKAESSKLPQSKLRHLETLAQELTDVQRPGMALDVLTFMVAFDQYPRGVNDPITMQDFELAERLISEEVKEMYRGFNKLQASQSLENLTEFVDGAIDTIYVILWTLLKFNVPVDKVFAEVQRSNMSKLLADGSYVKNEHGKVQKPQHWTAPDLIRILWNHYDLADWKGNMRNG